MKPMSKQLREVYRAAGQAGGRVRSPAQIAQGRASIVKARQARLKAIGGVCTPELDASRVHNLDVELSVLE